MGFIRGGLFVIASVLLFLVFLAGNIFLTLNLSLDYENVKPELVSAVRDSIGTEISSIGGIEQEFAYMEIHCENNSQFIFNFSEYNFEIPCEIVAQGLDAVIDYQVDSFVEEVYHKDYDCNFWDCIGETGVPFFFVSQKAMDYWKEKFYFALIISLALVVAMLFLIEHKPNLPIIVGSLLAISSLPFMKLNWVLSFIPDSSFLQFFTVFFTKSYTVFLISFVAGLVIFGAGIGLKFFQVGFKINNLFSKFSKNKEEVSKKETSDVKQEVKSKPKNNIK